MKLETRLTRPDDASYLTSWLLEPGILRWFPMCDEREVEDSVRLWMNYTVMQAGLTVLWDGVPCGMSILYIQPFKKLSHQCLFAIIVDQKFRGRGAGTFLMQAVMKHAKENFSIEVLHLEVYEENPAKRLYDRLGFTKFGEQRHFLKEGPNQYRTKIFMQKPL